MNRSAVSGLKIHRSCPVDPFMPSDFSSFMKLSFPNDPSFDPTSDIMSENVADSGALGPADFSRIGVGPRETRLGVIRSAAARASSSLASQQLDDPNPLTEQQLSQIAVSTYRLLDPRQRDDYRSRADIGRIRPGVLYQVGRTRFANAPSRAPKKPKRESNQSAPPRESALSNNPSEDPRLKRGPAGNRPDELIGKFAASEPANRVRKNQDKQHPNRKDRTPESDDLERGRPERRGNHLGVFEPAVAVPVRLATVRAQIHRPAMILALIFVLLMTAAAVWFWGQNLRSHLNPLSKFPVLANPEG